jgi:hypothetical protein
MKKPLLLTLVCFLSISTYAQTYIGLTGGLAAAKTNITEEAEMMFTGATSFKVERVTSLYYGAILSNGLGTNGRINLQAGFNVVTKGYESNASYLGAIEEGTSERDYTIKTFEIPLTLRIVIGRPNRGIDPYLIGGGYLGINREAHLSGEDRITDLATGEETYKVTYKNVDPIKPYDENDLAGSSMLVNNNFLSSQKDLGLIYGGGFAFNLGGPKLFIEAKSSKGFKSVFMDMNGDETNPKVENKVFYVSLGLLVPIFNRAAAAEAERRADD